MSSVILSTRQLPEPFDSLREDFDVRVLGGPMRPLKLRAVLEITVSLAAKLSP